MPTRAAQGLPTSVVLNNSNLAANAINPVTYQGIRAEVLYQFNQDWSALLAQSYQNIEADGVFAEMAANSLGEPLPDLSVRCSTLPTTRTSSRTLPSRLRAVSVPR